MRHHILSTLDIITIVALYLASAASLVCAVAFKLWPLFFVAAICSIAALVFTHNRE
jgi:hypothetical protein